MKREDIQALIDDLKDLPVHTPDPAIDTKMTADGVYDHHECKCHGRIDVVWIKTGDDGEPIYTRHSFRAPGALEALEARLEIGPEDKKKPAKTKDK